MGFDGQACPIDFRPKISFLAARVGNAFPGLGRIELGKPRKFISPAFGHRSGQRTGEIAEKKKWRRRAEFLTHEEERRHRCQQQDFHCSFHRLWRRELQDSFSERAVSYLIMILQKGNKSRWRQMGAAFSAISAMKLGVFPLESEAFRQAASELLERMTRIIAIVAVGFAGNQYMQRVMDVVVPLRAVSLNAASTVMRQVRGGVVAIFENQMNESIVT